jgi:hypothetical protein
LRQPIFKIVDALHALRAAAFPSVNGGSFHRFI